MLNKHRYSISFRERKLTARFRNSSVQTIFQWSTRAGDGFCSFCKPPLLCSISERVNRMEMIVYFRNHQAPLDDSPVKLYNFIWLAITNQMKL